MQAVHLPHRLMEQMLAHARSAPDVEVCGLIAARDGAPVRCIAVDNIAEDPRQRFTMDPKQQIEAFRSMREDGEDLFGIYHSHPIGPARPSNMDLQQCAYPDVVQIILSPDTADPAPLRCYRFIDGRAMELELTPSLP